MILIDILNPKNKSELDHFYAIGRAIRQKHSFQEIDWNDDHGLDQLIENETAKIQLITARSEEGIGRLVAVKYANQEEGILGWFECADNETISKALFDAAVSFFRENKCTKIIGPINGSTWNNYRFNKTAEKPLLPGEPYQPLYYIRLWEKYGFTEYTAYQSTLAPNNLFEPMTMDEGRELANQFHLKVDYYPPNPSPEFLEKMYAFYHTCFESNPLFKPINKEAYHKLSAKFAQILNVKHSLLVSDMDDNPVAITLSYNDVYHALYQAGKINDHEHAENRLFIKTIATNPAYQGKQIGTLMINLIHNLANQSGYQKIYHLLMYQNNLSATKGKEKFATQKVREYALYALEI